MGFFSAIFPGSSARAVRALRPLVERINGLESAVRSLPDSAFPAKTVELRKRLGDGEEPDALLPEAFALVREAARRTLGERHFDVQLMGGIVLHRGSIAEMRTGEGKTLVATLPAYLNALSGKGVHVVTVNDYLSRRDAVWMGQIYRALGLSVGVINHDASYLYDPTHTETQTANIRNQNNGPKPENEKKDGADGSDEVRDTLGSFKVVHAFLKPCARREAYAADVTYGTNNEFGFDYLRDNLEYEPAGLRQRDFHFAIVDEIDSILIDEARTPLIISAPTTESEGLYRTFAGIAMRLSPETDYTLDEKRRAVTLTESGIEKTEQALGVGNIYTEKGIKYVHHLETAVRAKALFRRDKEYVVRDGQVVIVDEFTGRLMPGRRWSEGLHQAIEAKEGVPIQKESRTFASITFQNYFRMYGKLAGMTGTAATSAEEFLKVYGRDVVVIPTNKPSMRTDGNDLIFQTEKGKFQAVARAVKALNARGQPVLIGTVSIEKNELLSAYLAREGVPHEVLNAKNHEREGEIIAQAGRRGAVTVATNMAGRGVDIKLGGNPASPEEAQFVREAGGLFVLGTERHEARRIDNQLRGRSGRQGDPGETRFFVSLEDTLMRVFASDTIKKMMGKFGIPEDQPLENPLLNRALETAQEKIEGFNFDARKHVLEYDDVLNYQRKIVYERRRSLLLGGEGVVAEKLAEMIGGDAAAQKTLEEKKKFIGEKDFYAIGRRIMLQTADLFWVEHLEAMEYLRGSVNLRAYGQRDPLVEYKKEGLRLFKDMEHAVGEQILRLIQNVGSAAFAGETAKLREVKEQAQLIGSGDEESDLKHAGNTLKSAPRGVGGKKIGRNDPCFCGSGKKFKQCGLINAAHHRRA